MVHIAFLEMFTILILQKISPEEENNVMAKKTFKASVSQDFEIIEVGKKIGSLRVKPNSISWKPKSGQIWYNVTLDSFALFAEENGKKTKA